jgi:hypothetical protein
MPVALSKDSTMRRSAVRRPVAGAVALALGVSLTIGAATGAAGAGSGYVTDQGRIYQLDTTTETLIPKGALARPLVALTTAADGELYGIDDADQSLQQIDPTTGAETRMGSLVQPADPERTFAALTTLPGGKLYASSYSVAIGGASLDGQLYVVDRASGAATARGNQQTDDALLSLAGSCGGTLFGVDDANKLVRVSTATGVATPVGALSSVPANASVALAFDHAKKTLWALVYQAGDGPEQLFTVDPASGTMTKTPFQSGQQGSDPSTLALDSPAQCRYARTVSLTHPAGTSRLEGVLRAPQRLACAASQRVRLMRQQPGADRQLGSVLTNGQGKFRLAAPSQRGKYYAVAAKRTGANGICLAAQSRTLGFVP